MTVEDEGAGSPRTPKSPTSASGSFALPPPAPSMWTADRLVGHVLSWLTYAVVYLQPGVDRHALWRWFYEVVPGSPAAGLMIPITFLLWVLPALAFGFYWALYHFEFPYIERHYRTPSWSSRAVGWNHPDPATAAAYRELTRTAAWEALRKHRLPPMLLIVCVLFGWCRWTGDFADVARNEHEIATVPDRWTSSWQMALGLLLFETALYWAHRVLHAVPWLYAHHKKHHAFVASNAVAGLFGDELDEWVTANAALVAIPWALRMHSFTVFLWFAVHYTRTHVDHGGYDLPYNPFQFVPFGASPRAHDFHHHKNCGNFGLYWGLWDWVCGTDAAYRAYERKLVLHHRLRTATPRVNGDGNGGRGGGDGGADAMARDKLTLRATSRVAPTDAVDSLT